MPSLGEFINNLAQKAGVLQDDEKLKALLASPELATIQIDDTLVTSMDRGLLNIEAAKNNHPEIKKVYTAAVYDGMDKHLLQTIADTFDATDLEEIKAEKRTDKKIELTISKLKAAKNKATGADKDELNRQIQAAHEAARLANEKLESTKTEYEAKIKDIHRQAAIKAVFGNYKTIYDDLPSDIRTITMEGIINKALQDKNAELRVDDNGTLQLVSKDGTSNVFGSNHVQLTPQSFLDQSFAPILKVSGPPQPAPTNRPPAPGGTPPTPPAGDEANTGFLKSRNDQVLADMAGPKASMI